MSNVRQSVLPINVTSNVLLKPTTETQLSFGFTSPSHSDKLFVKFIERGVSGYITARGFGRQDRERDMWYTLTLPQRHIVMLSFSYLLLDSANKICAWSFLRIHSEDNKHRVTEEFCTTTPESVMFYESSLTFHFCSFYLLHAFKAWFSIHAKNQRPVRLDNGLFVCNTSLYESFRHHLDCNFIVECQHGEDEHGCPDTTDLCRGGLQYGRKCYMYFSNKTTSWEGASVECAKHNATLAMMKTFREASVVRNIIKKGKRVRGVLIGLRAPDRPRFLYEKRLWKWVDMTVSYAESVFLENEVHRCSFLLTSSQMSEDRAIRSLPCDEVDSFDFICEVDPDKNETKRVTLATMDVVLPSYRGCLSLVSCPAEHVTRDFLSCDVSSACGFNSTESRCATSAVTVPNFACDEKKTENIPYSLVCDFYPDCRGGSDESFCQHEECRTDTKCKNGQCLSSFKQVCNYKYECRDGSDEYLCRVDTFDLSDPIPRFSLYVRFDSKWYLEMFRLGRSGKCPRQSIKCPGHFCLPIFVVCNGVYDCPGWEDEALCESYTCPGFYRCRNSTMCLHTRYLCDKTVHCPLQDDELLCDVKCPRVCRCQGLAAVCPRAFPARINLQLRYVDASGSGMTPELFSSMTYLIGLRLAHCHLTQLNGTFPNLQLLDLSDNSFSMFQTIWLSGFKKLKILKVARNPLAHISALGDEHGFNFNLSIADFSKTSLYEINETYNLLFSHLRILNLSGSEIKSSSSVFPIEFHLEVLDLRDTSIEKYPAGFLKSLSYLRVVYGERYKLCCKDNLPKHLPAENCHSLDDPLSSCDNLIRSDVYRVVLWIVSVVALLANIVNVVYLIFCHRTIAVLSSISTSLILLINMSSCHICACLYLLVIAEAGSRYHGDFWRHDLEWTSSITCFLIGVLSSLCDHISGIIGMALILERTKFLHRRIHRRSVGRRDMIAASALMWTLGVVVTVMALLLPGLIGSQDWRLFSHTGLCAPVVISAQQPSLFSAHFFIQLVMNMITAILTAYIRLLARDERKSDDLDHIRLEDAMWTDRVSALIMSDVMCTSAVTLPAWLSTLPAVTVSDDVILGSHLLVKPFKAAVNPLLSLYFTRKENKDRQNMQAFLTR